ncbi:MAG: HxsD-like protein [Candidatus Micrarchaeia archaeon]
MRQAGIVVDKKKNRVRVSFASSIYGSKSVEEAARDYSASCTVRLEKSKKGVDAFLEPKEDVQLEALGREFANYVLAKTREKTV